ncbi:class 1 fructose-bisphosphatase [Flavihumibacter petaseus]|uniref:Fructose-1,6-bisphosphatase class 1 n=1 Tax=Flavihumibacter petaseus NBRC 106054 TaxID=1220578 RepID=A0A0E9N0E5_9BACT|nr:class 1 fructose-bisphosphatase [Flavihumibacter petaseus]GAO43101.1 fructose-1,6-bisphosphatase class I [Flavihumibacter petaseus NBRC 106054]
MEQSRIALPIGSTLDRFLKKSVTGTGNFAGGLQQVLLDIALASKVVRREVNKAGLVDINGLNGLENAGGEQQKTLDMLAHIRFSRALLKGGEVCALVSEEAPEPEILNRVGAYVVAMDPLDGSGNIDVNLPIGTIFSIYRRGTSENMDPAAADLLQDGRQQVAAGYILYGVSTMFVFSMGNGVQGFTYEPSLGEFFLSHPDIRIPEDPAYYSVNESLADNFQPGIQQFIQYCRERRFNARYAGSLVADFHRNLLKGGVYLYPDTDHYPKGKLRLLYECRPLAYLVEQAGGAATDGRMDLLDVLPQSIHQRSPLIIGSPELVKHATAWAGKPVILRGIY